ncbi:MAG TPA: S9 family peptidase [Gammaproteobacteria bacterium]|nr:S9 family peptidase [Gammaproteobacteria bacterium]
MTTQSIARKIPRDLTLHGEHIVDDYFYLREKDNPEVIRYLEAENAYTEDCLQNTAGIRERLYQELLARIKQSDLSVPWRYGDWLYYSRTEEGRQYPIHCRKPAGSESEEIVLLDLNAMAEGESYMALGEFEPSHDGRLLAFSTDNTGYRQYRLYVKDLANEAILPGFHERVTSAAWAADHRTLFYTVENDAKRSCRLYRHLAGKPSDQAELLYEETDELFSIHVTPSRSRAYLFLLCTSLTTSEARYLRADDPVGDWRLIAPRRHREEYYPEHHGDNFYIRTNDRGLNFRLARAPVTHPDRGHWEEVLPHRESVMLEDVECFRDYTVLCEREDGLPRFTVMDPSTGAAHRIELPEPVYDAHPEINAEFDSCLFRFAYESLITPRSIYDYDMQTRERTLLKQTEVLGGFNPAEYRSERIHVTARDGARIPVSLVSRKDAGHGGGAPMLLAGYGAYGIPFPIFFSSNRLSLLDRGLTFAIAHVRGGGELGKPWHDAGRMERKMNTFTDFIDVAEHLIRERYTATDRLVITGRSAGGLLMGAVTNLRPDLFHAVVTVVPFVDVINTMLDESLPLTAGEWEEWGNPHNEAEYRIIREYCPYSNLEAKDYPAMLVRTSLNDSQVMYWEPAKYVAKLRTLKTDANPLLFQIDMHSGHGGSSGRYDALREVAFEYAFILSQLGIDA